MNDPLTGRPGGGGGTPYDNPITLSSTPALSQAIAPTWTEKHIFSTTSGSAGYAAADVSVQLATSSTATSNVDHRTSGYLRFDSSIWQGASAATQSAYIGMAGELGRDDHAYLDLSASDVGQVGLLIFDDATNVFTSGYYPTSADRRCLEVIKNGVANNSVTSIARFLGYPAATAIGIGSQIDLSIANTTSGALTQGAAVGTVFTSVTGSAESADFFVKTTLSGSSTERLRITSAGSTTITQATITDPANALSITGTWNDAADTFVGVLWNFTSTASATASKICDFQLGGVSRWNLRKDGIITHTGSGGSTFTVDPDTAGLNHSSGYIASNNCLRLTTGSKTVSDPAVSATQTWNAGAVTFTGLLLNVTDTASAAASKLADFQLAGNSVFAFEKSGYLNFGANYGVKKQSSWMELIGNGTAAAAWNSAGLYVTRLYLTFATQDVVLERDAAATLQMGSDAATATAQTLKAHDGSGTDKDGADFRLCGGQSTGTGRGGSVTIRTSLTSTTGSSANSYSTREFHNAKPVDLTESSATTIVTVAVAAGEYVSFDMYSTVFASDGTDHQSLPTRLNVSAVNKAGTVTATITAIDGTTAASAGTLTCTYTAAASGNNVIVQANAVSSLSQTILRSKWSINALNGNGTAAITTP